MFHARSAPTPKDTVYRDGKASLYRFRRGDGRARAPGTHIPVLLVPSMINRWYVFDLRRGASLVEALSADTPWDTFLFDWGVPGDEDRYVGWDDVVAKIERVVRWIQRTTGAPRVALLGYSVGATLSGIFAALRPDRVGALVNLAGPFDFAAAGSLSLMTDPRWFDVDALAAAGNVSAAQLQAGFIALAPTSSISKWVALFERIHEPGVRDAFFALESWAIDNVPFPGAAYATYVKELYQQNQLLRGDHWIRGERVDLARIGCPVLSIVADRDGICPAACVTALNAATGSTVKDVLTVPGGHVGAVVGSRAPVELYPKLVAWLDEHAARASAHLPESRL